MSNNPTDKNIPSPFHNPKTSLFANNTGPNDNKPSGTPLLGSTTGGLFSSAVGAGLFSNNATSQLKTSQRKQGGLFSNAPSQKSSGSQQAPKLNFGGIPNPTPMTGGLFGSNIASKKQQTPSGGLFFSSQTGSKLFSGAPTGGLFTNTTSFSTNAPSGGLFENTSQSSNQPTGGLFGNPSQSTNPPSGGLFGNPSPSSNPPSGGLFSNTGKQQQKPLESKSQPPTFGQTGSLFSNTTTQQKKQEKPTTGLFGSTTPGLFGSNSTTTPTGLFSGGQKKQGTIFPSSAQSKLFSKPNQPVTQNTLFGGSKKQEEKKPTQGGLFGTSTTPGSSLFSKPTEANKQSGQTPKFSLTGNVSTAGNTTSQGSIGLFGQTQKKEEQKKQPQINAKQVQQPKQPLSGGLFANVPTAKFSLTTNLTQPQAQKKPVQKPSTPSTLFGNNNTSSLFSQQKKAQPSKTAQTSGGLFNISGKQKKQAVPTVVTPTGSLFGEKKQQGKKQEVKPVGGLFSTSGSTLFTKPAEEKEKKTSTLNQQSGSTLFTNTDKPQTKDKKEPLTSKTTQQSLFTSNITKPATLQPTEKAVPSLFGTKQPEKSRTISFNQAEEKKDEKKDEGKQQGSQAPTFANRENLFQKLTVPKVNQIKGTTNAQDNLDKKPTQGLQKKTNIVEPTPALYNYNQQQKQLPPKSSSQSFFAQNAAESKPTQPQQQSIKTSLQISKILAQSKQRQQLKKTQLKSIEQWITLSFTRSNEILTTEMETKQFNLHKNQDINRFLNDLFREVVVMVNLPFEQKSFKLIEKLFDQLLDNLKIKEFLFKCTKVKVTQPGAITTTQSLDIVQLNNAYFTHHMMYKFTTDGIFLNLESSEVKKYILALTKKFISNHLEYLQFLQRKTEMLQLPYNLFYTLLKYCLSYQKLRMKLLPSSRQHLTEVVQLVEEFEKKIITKCSGILQIFTNDNFGSFQLINKQYLVELVRLLDDFSYIQEDALIKTALKVILNTIDIPNVTPQSGIHAQVKLAIQQTRSLQLLPIRTLVSCYEPNSLSKLSMISAHDLYHYISGPEWIDWLEVYLGSGMNSSMIMERQISVIEAKYMLNVLAYPKLKKKRISIQKMSLKEAKYIEQLQKKILPKKRPISRFIHTLKEQNMLDIFYLILQSLIYDYESYRKITETFFKQKDEFIYEFKVIVAEVCNYPVQKFKEEIPFMQEKMSYFLRICEVAPEKIVQIQKMVFDGIRMGDNHKKSKEIVLDFGNWDVGHRICHLVIDTINYFGMKQNQKIVAKAIGCIKQLLLNDYTSGAMKLAMAVNKPSMNFIVDKSSLMLLSQKLVIEMMELLEFFLMSDEFVNMLMVRLKSNNSEEVDLQRYYAVRYSVKDYKVLLHELGMLDKKQPLVFEQKNQVNKGQQLMESEKMKVEIVPSSFWFLRMLESMIRAFRQQKMSIELEKQLLHVVNLMLERVLMVLLEGDNELRVDQSTNQKNERPSKATIILNEQYPTDIYQTMPSTSPIYPISSQSQPISRVLTYIIQTLNTVDIFPLIKQKLTYSITKSQVKSSPLQNTQIIQNYHINNNLLFRDYEENQLTVYLTISVLKNIVTVYRQFELLKNAKPTPLNITENKMMYKLLSKMRWLLDLQQQVFVKTSTSTGAESMLSSQSGTVHENSDIVLGLVTLLSLNNTPNDQPQTSTIQQSEPINMKLSFQKPLVLPITDGQQTHRISAAGNGNLNKVEKFYSLYKEQINYQQVHDFMVISDNKYLESFQSLQSVAIDILGLLVQPDMNEMTSYKLNLIKHLTFTYQSSFSSTTWLLELLSNQLLAFLNSAQSSIQLKQSILSLLQSMIETSQSTGGFIFAKKVFYKFIKTYLMKNYSLGPYHTEHRNRMNLIIVKILNTLFDKDHFNFTSILSVQFIDQLVTYIVTNTEQVIISSQSVLKYLRSFSNKYLYPKEMTYYQMETSSEQRYLVSVGDALVSLKQAIIFIEKLFFDQEIKRLNDEKKVKFNCIKRLSSLLIRTNLPYLPVEIWANGLSSLQIDNFNTIRIKSSLHSYQPRVFSINLLMYYITYSTSTQNQFECFSIYKQNILNYVSQKSIRFAQLSLRFLTWSLTVDTTLYGNQPIKKLQYQQSKMSCSSHMGTYLMTAIQMFGENQIEAVCRVKQLYELSLNNLANMSSNNKLKGYCFVQTITVMGYCVQWLRARKDTDDTLSVLIKSTLSSSKVWLQPKTLSHPNIIKLVHSLSSIATTLRVNPQILGEIKLLISQLVSKYMQNRTIFINQSIIHELLIILINFPISIEDSETISNVTKLWQSETNSQFFYNLSRLMVQYGLKVPGELARLKALTKCQKVAQLFNQQTNLIIPQCYHYGMRSPESISIIWVMKLASTMISSSQQSVLLLEQVSEFYTLVSGYIETLLKYVPTTGNISFVYLELLQAVTEFLLTLVSSPGWVAINRVEFQKITFLLSHKLINVIMDTIGGKLLVTPESQMERRLKKQSSLTSGYMVTTPQLDTTSTFKLFADLQIFTLLGLYTKLLSQSLYNSQYILKYFNSPVYENFRYGVSYWDRMNKSIGDMVKYGVTMRRRYQKLSQGKSFINKLYALNDFSNCSQYFVETGYLVSMYDVPETSSQFLNLIDQVISGMIELGNVHLVQESQFRQRYQCIMKGNIQKFGNKLIDNVKLLHKFYEDDEKNYSTSLMSTEKHQTNNYPQYYQIVGKNLNFLVKNV